MPKPKPVHFKRPQRKGIRKSKNAQYYPALRGKAVNLVDFGTFTGRQIIFLSIVLLSFYLFICFALIKTSGVTAAMPLFVGLGVFVVAIALVWWFHNRRFYGDQDVDQSSDEAENPIYPDSRFGNSRGQENPLVAVDRVEFSDIQEGDIPLIVKPAPIIQAIPQNNVALPQPLTKKAKRARVDLEQAKQHYRSGTTLLKQEQLEEAKAAFQKASELNPDLAKAHEGLGRVYLKQAQYQAATIAFQRAIATSPDLAAAHEGLGRSLLHQGQLEDAKTTFHQAIQLDDQFFRAYEGLGRTCFKMGQVEQAIGLLRKALEINPKYQPAISLLKRVEDQGKIK